MAHPPKKKQVKKTVLQLFWTISPKQMSLLIWLRLILKLRHLVIHPAYLQTFVDLFWLIWGAQMAPPKKTKAT